MSPRASKEVKMQTAFRLYDYDNDGYLMPSDIAELLKAVSTTKAGKELLVAKEVTEITEAVMRDCDIDGNNRLSYAEFAKVLGRIPDFTTNFKISIS
jgi:calcium and integrin-binding protein 1